MHFDREEGIILSLDKGYILISRGLLPPLEEGHIWSGASRSDRYRNAVRALLSLWVWHIFTHARQKSSRHVPWPVCFEFERSYRLGS